MMARMKINGLIICIMKYLFIIIILVKAVIATHNISSHSIQLKKSKFSRHSDHHKHLSHDKRFHISNQDNVMYS